MPLMYRAHSIRPSWPLLFFLVLLGLTFAAYWPGLGGSFLLDDWGTLPKLGAYGPVDNFTTFVSYITSGAAGPSGRPLALLTFLIDARNWPAGPWPFKLTNVILHLVNGAMLAWLLVELCLARGLDRRKAAWVGCLAAGLWMAHPLFVSTTLYVVQRMAMLAALFVFAGLACYVAGRRRLQAGRPRSGYALMAGGIVGGTVLGFLCKENAALLPLLALVLEATVLKAGPGSRVPGRFAAEATPTTQVPVGAASAAIRHDDTRSALDIPANSEQARSHTASHLSPHTSRLAPRIPSRAFRLVFLWLPGAVIIAYLLWQLRDIGTLLPGRDFTVGTRLLTEARVLVYYLYLLVIPHAATHGLYTVVPLSHGFLHPWTTLPAVGIIVALVVGAFTMRHRWPVLSAAILFFFAGQLLESTTIPLEVYYEHRNYLPAALLFWPLALWVASGPGSRSLRYAAAGLALVLLLVLTGLRANLWGHPDRMAQAWMRLNPGSSRAVATQTEILESQGKYLKAYLRLYAASELHPDRISFALPRIEAACRLGEARPSDVTALAQAAANDRSASHLLYKVLSSQIGDPSASCRGFGNAAMMRVVDNALSNPNYRGNHAIHQQMNLLRGQILLAQHRPRAAYKAFSEALELDPTPDVALTASAYLLDAGQPRAARKLLRRYRALPRHLPPVWTMQGLHRRWLEHVGWYSESFRNIRKAIREKLQSPG